jgi:signal transduction histidine kinase
MSFIAGSHVLQDSLHKKVEEHVSYRGKHEQGQEQTRQEIASIRRSIYQLNLTGASGIIISLYLIAVLVKDIHRGLSVLFARAARLSKDATLIPLNSNRDELKILDLHFQTMANALTIAEKNKQEILTRLSHDLQVPLNLMMLDIQRISSEFGESEACSELSQAISQIGKSTSDLICLLDDLIELDRLKNGNLTLRKENVALFHLCQESLKEGTELAQHKRIHLEVVQRGLPSSFNVGADQERLKRVLFKLLIHSIASAPEKSAIQIEMRSNRQYVDIAFIRRSEHDNDRPSVSTTALTNKAMGGHVRAPYRADRRAFTQMKESDLALCKGLIEAHGGEFYFEESKALGGCGIRLPLDKDFTNPQQPLQLSSID